MTLDLLLQFLAIVAFSAYFQTVTGFGLGMIMTGAMSGLGLMPIATIATINSLLSLVNSAVALPGALRTVAWRIVGMVLCGMVPGLVVGVLLLDYLHNASALVLKFLLGLTIIYGGISVAIQPVHAAREAGRATFIVTGVFSGALAGLFGMAGPPLVYQFYRQPLGLPAIRYSLIFLFATSASLRTVLVAGHGQLSTEIVLLTLIALPVGAVATFIAKRYPPRLNHAAMRRLASAALVIIGLTLIWPLLRQSAG
ncbi:sulfite exporter TauE/SafE family protein [Noviherbaspirillum saxi]|uniref:Probable membrane transporter protein n=1 Tax=Noviherbaspirillum saxi TaxID=2320863 RepID=A0A3A3G2H4_9BURK|nr:sulfite exporter TauE/SafE family protein [Noviherbaspirillum saxi]RJF95636.1 sulfite exporter TauE/SafE family protein [Noviherbaspirillum saxi]